MWWLLIICIVGIVVLQMVKGSIKDDKGGLSNRPTIQKKTDVEYKSMSYNEIVDYMIETHIHLYGEDKFKKILDKVMTSNKISGLISTLRYKGVPPGSKDFLYCLHEIPYFLSSHNQTVAIAALLALERWNEEVNSQQFLLNEDGLRLRAVNILRESGINLF